MYMASIAGVLENERVPPTQFSTGAF